MEMSNLENGSKNSLGMPTRDEKEKVLPLVSKRKEKKRSVIKDYLKGAFHLSRGERLNPDNVEDKKILDETMPFSYAAKLWMEEHAPYGKRWFAKFGLDEYGKPLEGITPAKVEELHQKFQAEKTPKIIELFRTYRKKPAEVPKTTKKRFTIDRNRIKEGFLDALYTPLFAGVLLSDYISSLRPASSYKELLCSMSEDDWAYLDRVREQIGYKPRQRQAQQNANIPSPFPGLQGYMPLFIPVLIPAGGGNIQNLYQNLLGLQEDPCTGLSRQYCEIIQNIRDRPYAGVA